MAKKSTKGKSALERLGVEGLAQEFEREADRLTADAEHKLHLAKSYREAAERLRDTSENV